MPKAQAIGDYALLGDCQGAALVGKDGSIDWWCAPRFDSRSSFARLLDADAGHWSVRPTQDFEVEREYLPGTLVLQTTFTTGTGSARLTDALALAPGARGHDIGLDSPHAIVRRLEGLEGEVELAVDFSPRLEYGLVTPTLVPSGDGAIETVGGPDTLLLSGHLEWLELTHGTASGELVIGPGERVGFALQHRQGIRRGGGSRAFRSRRWLG